MWMVTAAIKLKDACSLEGKLWQTLDSLLKSRDITLPTKVHIIKATVFPVVMCGCEQKTHPPHTHTHTYTHSVLLQWAVLPHSQCPGDISYCLFQWQKSRIIGALLLLFQKPFKVEDNSSCFKDLQRSSRLNTSCWRFYRAFIRCFKYTFYFSAVAQACTSSRGQASPR